MYNLARVFILVMPGCPSCNSCSTAFCPFGGTSTGLAQKMQSSYTEISCLLDEKNNKNKMIIIIKEKNSFNSGRNVQAIHGE